MALIEVHHEVAANCCACGWTFWGYDTLTVRDAARDHRARHRHPVVVRSVDHPLIDLGR